jgi:hypothetical protein
MNPDKIYQKSLSSFLLGGLSILLEVMGLIMLLFGNWIIALLLVSCGIAVSYMAYKKAGGKENSALYENKDLYELVSYGVRCAQVKIGFHSSRDQSEILECLVAAGFPCEKADIRTETRKLISRKRDAFDACRKLMIIELYLDKKEIFCDGYANKKDARAFLESEIIINASDASSSFKKALCTLIK